MFIIICRINVETSEIVSKKGEIMKINELNKKLKEAMLPFITLNVTNMVDGAKLTNDLDTNLVAIEGSGSAIPPVKTNKNIVLVGANQPIETLTEYFGPFRIKLADLIIITMCDEQICSKDKLDNLMIKIREMNPDAEIIPTIFRPYPVESIENKNILLIDDIYTTGSTVNECSRVLRQGNPNKVGILTLAKD